MRVVGRPDGLLGDGDERVDERAEMAAFCAEALPELVGALTHQFGDRWLAQELAQEALIRACDRWPRVRSYASPTGWAFRVGVNLGRSRLRRRAAERRALARRPPDAEWVLEPTDAMDLHDAVAALPERQREAVVLQYFLGLTAVEAAELVGIRPGAMRTRTSRAVAALRTVLVSVDEGGLRER